MKMKYLLFLVPVAVLASCSTAYRSAQTPDDVYYSPATHVVNATAYSDDGSSYSNNGNDDEYVTSLNEKDQNSYAYRNEEYQIRRGIENPIYRNTFTLSMGMGNYIPYSSYPYISYAPYYGFGDPYYDLYGYNYYGYPYGKSFMSPYSYYGSAYPYSFGNYYGGGFYGGGFGYSPFYSGLGYSPILFAPGHANLNPNTNKGARRYNLNAYKNEGNTGVRGNWQPSGTTQPATSAPVRRSGVGNVIRRVFTPTERNSYRAPSQQNTRVYRNTENQRSYNNDNYNNNNNNRQSYQPPVRSFSPSESSTPSSGSNNSAPVRSFRR